MNPKSNDSSSAERLVTAIDELLGFVAQHGDGDGPVLTEDEEDELRSLDALCWRPQLALSLFAP